MTGEEFTAVLNLIHPQLNWNYGSSKRVAGIVLRDGSPNPVKLMEFGSSAEDTLQRLIKKLEAQGWKI